MTRKGFIRVCSLLGISLPFEQAFIASRYSNNLNVVSTFKRKVQIVGVGAPGLSVAYRLSQIGINYEVIEVSSSYGGRMKTTICTEHCTYHKNHIAISRLLNSFVI